MVTIKVKDGTPEGTQSLCVSCRWGHVVRGFRESQEVIHCTWLSENPEMQFPVSRCSFYDRRIPSRRGMEQIAWILLTKKAGRTIGFVTAKQFCEIEGDDAEIIPAAAICPDLKNEWAASVLRKGGAMNVIRRLLYTPGAAGGSVLHLFLGHGA